MGKELKFRKIEWLVSTMVFQIPDFLLWIVFDIWQEAKYRDSQYVLKKGHLINLQALSWLVTMAS